jgi:hypothetical protein
MSTKLDTSNAFAGLVTKIPRPARAVINFAERHFKGPYVIEIANNIRLLSVEGKIVSTSEFTPKNLEAMETVAKELNS